MSEIPVRDRDVINLKELKEKKGDLYLSYSKLRMFNLCEKSFQFALEGTKISKESEKLRYSRLNGVMQHWAMDKFFKEKMYERCRSEKEMIKVIKEMFLEIDKRFIEASSGIQFGIKYQPLTEEQFLSKLKRGFFELVKLILKNNLYKGKLIRTEQECSVRYRGFILSARFDLLLVKGGIISKKLEEVNKEQVFIFDLKSKKSNSVDREQLDFYRLLFGLKFGDTVEGTGFIFPLSKEVTLFKYDKDRDLEMARKVDTVIDKIEKGGEFKYSPSGGSCFWCAYTDNCKYVFKKNKELTEEERKRVLEYEGDEIPMTLC